MKPEEKIKEKKKEENEVKIILSVHITMPVLAKWVLLMVAMGVYICRC